MVYEENKDKGMGDLALDNFKENYTYRIGEDKEDLKSLSFITEVGKEDDIFSLVYIRLVVRIYYKELEAMEEEEFEKDLEAMVKMYIFPLVRFMISSLTEQSLKLLPYFIKPIDRIEKLES